MKKIIILIIPVFLAFFTSCCKECPTCPAEKNDIMVIEFQDGLLPDPSYAGTEDTHIRSNPSANNYNTANYMIAGQLTAVTNRSLIKFDITSLVPNNVEIVKAYLTLYSDSYDPLNVTLSCYAPTYPWDSTDVTWNNSGFSHAWTGGDYGAEVTADTAPDLYNGYFTFSIDPVHIKNLLSNTNYNYGFLIRASVEDGTDHYIYFYTKETSFPSKRPKLTIYYRLP